MFSLPTVCAFLLLAAILGTLVVLACMDAIAQKQKH